MCTRNKRHPDLFSQLPGEHPITLEKSKGFIAQSYLILLAASALLCRPVFHNCMRGLQYCEDLILWKTIPWTLIPMLICALLAAFFIEKGYRKNVGIAGILLMLAATVVQSGSMLWMTTLGPESDVPLVELNDHPIRLPMLFFFIGLSFMRGGAIALMLSLLSRVRFANNTNKETQRFASIAILTSVLAIWLIVAHLNLTWPLVGTVGLVFVLMLIPALFYYIGLDKDRIASVDNDEPKEYQTNRIKPSILPILIIIVSAVIIISFWRYLPKYCWEEHLGRGPANAFAMSISSLAMGFGILAIRKKEANHNRPLIGSILLLIGLPIVPLLLDYTLLTFIPQVAIGVGLAMILGPLMDDLVMVPTKHYALTWVGLVAVIVIVSKLLMAVFNWLTPICKGMSVNMYILYPFISLSLVSMCFFLRRK